MGNDARVLGEVEVAAPYREDPREAELKKLAKQLKEALCERDSYKSCYSNEMAQRRADNDRVHAEYKDKLDRERGGRLVRGFATLMMMLLTVLWFCVNTAALVGPVYAVYFGHRQLYWLHLMWLAMISWAIFYFRRIAMAK